MKSAVAGGAALGLTRLRQALAAGVVEEGVHRVRGDARINGMPVRQGARVKPGDVVTTGRDAELVPLDDPKEAETVRTTHHDQPRYIYAKGMPRMIETAPVVNHTDAELILLESLVGHRPPFVPGKY